MGHLTPFYIYENAAAVKGHPAALPELLYSNVVTITQPVDPDTSIRRQGGMSMFSQSVAIRKRTSLGTCKKRAYPEGGVNCLLLAGWR